MAGKADLVNSIVDSTAAWPQEAAELDAWLQASDTGPGLDPSGVPRLDPFG
jgi:hypothetical protein